MGRILEEPTSQINSLLWEPRSVVTRWTKCQIVQKSVGATDAVAGTPSLSNVVQSCNSAERHSAVAAAAQWLQRDSVGLAAVRSSASRCIYVEHLFNNLGCFSIVDAVAAAVCGAGAVGNGSASSNTDAEIQREL